MSNPPKIVFAGIEYHTLASKFLLVKRNSLKYAGKNKKLMALSIP